jgi:mersacidin/lichenicidin family type 2 lantibiotic
MEKPTKENARKLFAVATAATGLLGQAHSARLTPDMIVRAWKSEAYRQTLSAEQLRQLPANPAGQVHLAGTELALGDQIFRGTCDHGCPCDTHQINCSGTAAIDCSNTSAIDCSNTSAIDCCNTSCADC